MADFVGCDRDCGKRPAIELVISKSHSLGLGIIVVAFLGALHSDALEAVLVEQVPGELGA